VTPKKVGKENARHRAKAEKRIHLPSEKWKKKKKEITTGGAKSPDDLMQK